MLEGLLIDLVPYDARYKAREHDWHNGPGVYYWSMGGQWIVSQAEIDRHHREETGEPERPTRLRFGMQTKDGTPIGLFGATWIVPHHRLAMLTALIGEPDYWGGGYGTDALLLTVDYLFDWLDMHKVWLMTMSLNARVMRQMEKVNFRLEARYREATYASGAWHDALVYGILRDEWPGRAALVEQLKLRPRSTAGTVQERT
jgi:ribosomal-protein-alanine N-acetyltransferase